MLGGVFGSGETMLDLCPERVSKFEATHDVSYQTDALLGVLSKRKPIGRRLSLTQMAILVAVRM